MGAGVGRHAGNTQRLNDVSAQAALEWVLPSFYNLLRLATKNSEEAIMESGALEVILSVFCRVLEALNG